MCSIKAVIAYGLRRAFELKDVREQEERETPTRVSHLKFTLVFSIYYGLGKETIVDVDPLI